MRQGYSCVGRSLSVSAANYPDKLALVEADGDRSLTYRQFNELANQLAHYLLSRGVGKGDHVGILAPNSIEHILALYAAAKIGGVAIALDPRATTREIARNLAFFECKTILVEEDLRDRLNETDMRHLPKGIIEYSAPGGKAPGLLDIIQPMPRGETGVVVLDDDPFTMILTSGTTGVSKGVIRSHHNVEIGCLKDTLGKGLDAKSIEVVVAPIYYGTARGSIMGMVYLGGTVHIFRSFDPARTAEYIGRERITALALAPTMIARLLKLPDLEKYDFSSLRSLRKAGSPIPTPMLKDLMARITPHVYQGFASTESGGVTMLKPEEQLARPGCAGLPRWGVEIEIIDADGKTVPRGAEGEIRVRSANVCMGYYKNPEENARAFRDGWYHTGDLGHVDEEGYLYVVGRIKDTIKTGSINVAPREIESVILELPGVDDVAVVGVPDPEWGEAVKAVVALRQGAELTAGDVLAHCRLSLAGFKTPKYVTFAPTIGRNVAGKITAEFKAAAVRGDI